MIDLLLEPFSYGYMTNATYQDYNTEGELHALLKTPKMTHYPDNDTTQFLKPNVIKDKKFWFRTKICFVTNTCRF